MHYNQFRYYDCGTGQYVSQDPIGLQGGENPYGYVYNPLSWVDPLGLCKSAPIGAAPRGMPMPDFEQQALSSDTGIKLSWDEIVEFANSLDDITTCYLAALSNPVQYESLCNGELESCLALINISDSTSWEIKLR